MFGGPLMSHFARLNGAVVVFWIALVFAVFVEILWIDLVTARRHGRRERA